MKAFEVDPNLPEAHYQLGWIYGYFHWNPKAAAKEFRRARELGMEPRSGRSPGPLSGRLRIRHQRIEEGSRERSSRLGPHLKLGTAYAWAHRHDEAIEVYRKAVELHPDSSEAHELLADAYAMKGNHREAVDEQKRALEKASLDDWAEELGRDFAALGWEKAQKNLNRKRLDEMTTLAKEERTSRPYRSPLCTFFWARRTKPSGGWTRR